MVIVIPQLELPSSSAFHVKEMKSYYEHCQMKKWVTLQRREVVETGVE
jgi:hypothetical protein